MAWSSTSRGPRFSPSPQASKVRTVLVCWRLGGRAPYQFSSLGPALSFHHHDTADQVPLCLRPVATKPCRIPCFDSRHSLWARGCLLFFVARPPPPAGPARTRRCRQSNRPSEERRALPHPRRCHAAPNSRARSPPPLSRVSRGHQTNGGLKACSTWGLPPARLCKAEILTCACALRPFCRLCFDGRVPFRIAATGVCRSHRPLHRDYRTRP